MSAGETVRDLGPYFLVGAERSGTTVLRLMLDHHPQIAWLNEFEYAVDCVDDGQSWPEIDRYGTWLSTHRVFRATGFEIDGALDYPHLVASFLEQRRARTGKPVVGATCHRHFDRLLRIWPEARFIHLVRDPRDVARSCIGMGWAGNVYTGVGFWIEAEQLWERVRRTLAPERYVEIQQEDLIREPEPPLRRACALIGVEYDPQMLRYPEDTTYAAPDPKLVEQWRRKASEEEVRLVEARVGELLTQRGYSPSGLPVLRVTPTMERKLQQQDKQARRQFRIDRFGWRLWLADVVSRRFGWASWRRRVQLELNEVDTRHLK